MHELRVTRAPLTHAQKKLRHPFGIFSGLWAVSSGGQDRGVEHWRYDLASGLQSGLKILCLTCLALHEQSVSYDYSSLLARLSAQIDAASVVDGLESREPR